MSDESRVEDLLTTGVEETVQPMSEIEAILRGEPVTPHSRVAKDLINYNPSDVLITKRVTENGTYRATQDQADGYSEVTVAVPDTPLDTLNATENKTYRPETGRGFGEVNVNVPPVVPVLDTLNVTENGTYNVPSGVDGYDTVIVDVAGGTLVSLIPPLTANNSSDVGIAIRDSAATDSGVAWNDRNFPLEAWHAFDGSNDTCWGNGNTGYSSAYLGFHWFDEVTIRAFRFRVNKLLSDRATSTVNCTIWVSDDGVDYTSIRTFSLAAIATTDVVLTEDVKTNYVKFTLSANNAGWSNYCGISEVTVYGY